MLVLSSVVKQVQRRAALYLPPNVHFSKIIVFLFSVFKFLQLAPHENARFFLCLNGVESQKSL